MDTRKNVIVLTLAICFALSAPALGQQSTKQQSTKKYNWMFEYVELRRYARTVRALGTRAAELPFSPRIVGGTLAFAADNPFQVALLLKDIANNSDAQFCGGTLIKPNIVVTAAHCSDFIGGSPSQVQVLTGTRKLDGSGVRRDVSKITVHPNWDPETFNNDVAVFRLSSNATNITLATLATADGSVGADLLATGWGALAEGGTPPIDLRRVQVPLVAHSNCNDANSYNGAITDIMLCAGLDAGGFDTCTGDSGGPLTRGTGNTVLTGITSWGRGCARPNLFGVYTRVSNATIRNFIEKND
jgi:secreted trypsin-like serine protease